MENLTNSPLLNQQSMESNTTTTNNNNLQSIISTTPFLIFFPMFLSIYLIGYFLVFKNWPPKFRPEAASCFISLFHGTPAVIIAAYSIINPPQQQLFDFIATNTRFQNTVLEFSISYFTMDLIHYLIFDPADVMFIGHHLATLFVFITCRFVVSRGAFSILVLLILAEVTSLLQNLWTLANARRLDNEFAAKAYGIISLPFYVLYTIARVVLGPLFVYKMGCCFLRGDGNGFIPTWVWGSWIVVIVTAICVSILWISNLWLDFFREWYCKTIDKKVQ